MDQPSSIVEPVSGTAWSPFTRHFLLIVILAAGVWLAVVMAPLLQAVGIAVLLALLLNPLVLWLIRRLRLGRTAAALLVFGFFLLVLLGIPIWVGSLAVVRLAGLGADLAAAFAELRAWVSQPIDILGYRLELTGLLGSFESVLQETMVGLPSGSLDLLSNISTNLLWTLTVIVTLYYFLRDGHRIKPWVLAHIPPAQQAELGRLADQVEEIWGKFLRIQLLLFLILAVLLSLGTLLVIWLFRSGLVRWSPFGFVLLLLAVYTAVQQIDNLWLRPQYMGRHLQLHPGIVFIGLIGGIAFGGLLGAIIGVPLIATARIVGKYLYFKIVNLSLPADAIVPPPRLIASPPPQNIISDSGSVRVFNGFLVKTGVALVYGVLLIYSLFVWGRTRLQALFSRFRFRSETTDLPQSVETDEQP